MIKFCPMCGSKVIVGSKFCNGCGLNLTDYQKKLDRLAASEKSPPPRAGNIVNAPTELPATSARQQKGSVPDFNLQEYIRSLGDKYGDLQKVYFNVEDAKSKTKIQAAQRAYAGDAKKENVIFVFDDTVFGAADDGFLVTDKNIYVHNMDEAALKISLAEINSCSIKKTLFNRRIVLNGNAEIQLTGYDRPAAEKMRDLFKEIRATFCGQAATTVSAPASTELPANTARQQKDSGSDSNLQEYIRSLDEKYGYLDKVYFNLQREKNQRKINSARQAYASEATNENVIFVFDNTLFGSADDGFLVTDKNIYVHNMDEWKTFSISHVGIKSYSFKEDVFARKVIGHSIMVNDAKKITLNSYTEPQAKTMIELLKDIKATFSGQAATTISAPAPPPAPKPKSTPPPKTVSTSPRPQTSQQPKPRYFTMETYVCDDPEAERFFQLSKAEKDSDKKMDYLEAAVNKGHIGAKFSAVSIVFFGMRGDDEVSKSFLKSLSEEQIEDHMRFLTNIAEAGLVEAMAILGIEYDDGKLVPRDLSKAHYWYEKYLQAGLDTPYSDLVNRRFRLLEERRNIKESLVNNTKRVFQTVVRYNRDAIDRIEGKISLRCFYFNGSQRSQKAFDKLRAALDSYCTGLLQEDEFAVACFDSTARGSADEGCLLTNRGIYIHNHGEDVKFIGYENITKNDIAVRGGNAYIGNVKIRTSVCNYNGDEHVKFFAIIWAFKNSFGG